MSIQLVRVEWTGKAIASRTIPLTDVESVNVTLDSEIKSSKARITLTNPYKKFNTGFTQPFSKYVADSNDIYFAEGDVIKIYAASITQFRALDTSSSSEDLILTGEISEVQVSGGEKSAKVNLTVVDKTFVMLNRLWSYAYQASDGLTTPQIIKEVIRSVTDEVSRDPQSFDSNGVQVTNGTYSVDARLVSEGGYIEDTRPDGTAFPVTTMAKTYKPAYEFIADLSTRDATNNFDGRDTGLSTDDEENPTVDRKMIFYVDEQNRFHWFYPRSGAVTTLSSGINSTVTTVSLTSTTGFSTNGGTFYIGDETLKYNGISGNDLTGVTRGANGTVASSHNSGANVTSAIRIIEGDSTTGNIVQSFSLTKKTFDVINMVIFNAGTDLSGNGILSFYYDKNSSEKQLKQTYRPYLDIAKDLVSDEVEAGNLTIDNTQYDFNFNGNFYKAGGAYPLTTTWGESVSSDADFKSKFRDKCIKEGKQRAAALTAKRGSPRWAGSINLLYRRYTAGELVEFTSTRAGINEVELRIKNVQYNFTKSGAFCQLNVEEDERKTGS